MPKIIVSYVKYVDYASTKFGRMAMYLIFLMIGTLLLGAITRNILNFPLSWTVEMAQFTITAYYILGGPYSMQMDDHVRMDLIYGLYSDKTKAKIDVFTNIFLLVYLIVLLIGSISSTQYAIEYGQRKFSQWNPSMIPIKLIMTFGIFLMILQTISTFFKDLAKSATSKLSSAELRLAMLLRLNLSSKEIASILRVTPDSVRVARYRLRKKLPINSKQELVHFLMNL